MPNIAFTPPAPKIREQDPITIQRIKEASYVTKLISEAQVAARKLHYYSGIATDQEVKDFFTNEARLLTDAARVLQDYYESMTKE
ncbi:MAG: hypothetical protein H0Z38_09450 [Firmicutes bacterium]|nr:hypothetical protein [Bacillota bacterium]